MIKNDTAWVFNPSRKPTGEPFVLLMRCRFLRSAQKLLRLRLNNSIVACFCLFTKFVISFSRLPKITSTDLAPAMTLTAGLQTDVVRHDGVTKKMSHHFFSIHTVLRAFYGAIWKTVCCGCPPRKVRKNRKRKGYPAGFQPDTLSFFTMKYLLCPYARQCREFWKALALGGK